KTYAALQASLAGGHAAAGAAKPVAPKPAAEPTEKIAPVTPAEQESLIPAGSVGGRQAFILPPNRAPREAIAARMANGESLETVASGTGARIVIMNDAGQLVKTEHGFVGELTQPPATGAGKGGPRFRDRERIASVEQVTSLLDDVIKLKDKSGTMLSAH